MLNYIKHTMKTVSKETTFEDIRKKTLDIIYSGMYNDADEHISMMRNMYHNLKNQFY